MVTRIEPTVRMRAIRGATTVAMDDPALIGDAVRELLQAILAENAIDTDDIGHLLQSFDVLVQVREEVPDVDQSAGFGVAAIPRLLTREAAE